MLYVRFILTVFLFDLSIFLTVDVTGDTAYDEFVCFFHIYKYFLLCTH